MRIVVKEVLVIGSQYEVFMLIKFPIMGNIL